MPQGDADSLIELLPKDNRDVSRISITNVQDLCTALEVAYRQGGKRVREKDNFTLKQRILTLHNENHSIVDKIISKWSLSQANQCCDFGFAEQNQKINVLWQSKNISMQCLNFI